VCEFGSKYRYFDSLKTPIAWDCTENDPAPGVAPKDVNKDGTIELLRGHNDWASINLAAFAPGAGAPKVTIPKVHSELHMEDVARVFASLTVPRITAAIKQNGIEVRWSRVPLDAVVAYEVLRTRAGQPPLIIRQTKKTEFLDMTAVRGIDYRYQIRLVVTGSRDNLSRRPSTGFAASKLWSPKRSSRYFGDAPFQ
jgi:hypothetical protein